MFFWLAQRRMRCGSYLIHLFKNGKIKTLCLGQVRGQKLFPSFFWNAVLCCTTKYNTTFEASFKQLWWTFGLAVVVLVLENVKSFYWSWYFFQTSCISIAAFCACLCRMFSMAVITSAAFRHCSSQLGNELPHLLDSAAVAESTEMERGRRLPPFTSCLLGGGVCMHRQPALNLWG